MAGVSDPSSDASVFRPGIPGTAFKDGKLYVFSRDQVLVMRPWGPDAGCWEKSVATPYWHPARPLIRLFFKYRKPKPPARVIGALLEPHASAKAREVQLLLRFPGSTAGQKAALDRFYELIPADVSKIVTECPCRQWSLLQLLNRTGDAALDLARCNLALAVALSNSWVFHRVQKPMRAARALVKKKQRSIMEWLGFPGTNAAVRVMRKVVSTSLEYFPRLLYLRDVMHDPGIMKILCHLPRINATVVRICSDPGLAQHVSPRFLAEACELRGEHRFPHLALMLRDTLQMAHLLDGRILARIQSVRKLAELHEELIGQFGQLSDFSRISGGEMVLPPQPLPGTCHIVPITDVPGLFREGREQKNCVLSYAPRIHEERTYVYSVITTSDRATLSIVKTVSGWIVEQLLGRRNTPVSAETHARVRQWLCRSQNSSSSVLR